MIITLTFYTLFLIMIYNFIAAYLFFFMYFILIFAKLEISDDIQYYFPHRLKYFTDNVVGKLYEIIDYNGLDFNFTVVCHAIYMACFWRLGARNLKDYDCASKPQIFNANTHYDKIINAFNPLLFNRPISMHRTQISQFTYI